MYMAHLPSTHSAAATTTFMGRPLVLCSCWWWLWLSLVILMTGSTTSSTVLATTASSSTTQDNNNSSQDKPITIVVMPKSVDNPFFAEAEQGCHDQAAQLTRSIMSGSSTNRVIIKCNYTGPPADANDTSGELQAAMVLELLQRQLDTGGGIMEALAIAVRTVDTVGPVIQQVVEAGIPVVTFDSDAPDTGRAAYVGTDNYFFGSSLAKVLKQLVPTGGTYGVVYSAESLNLQERLAGFVDELHAREPVVWKNVNEKLSPYDITSNITKSMEAMHALANLEPPPTAIIPVMGMRKYMSTLFAINAFQSLELTILFLFTAAMRSGYWKEFVDEHRHKNITLVSGDAMTNQLEFLARGYVQGLVGQLPYDFGSKSVQMLYELLQDRQKPEKEIIGTNVLTHLQVPLVLPKLTVDHNLLGNLHMVGLILYGLVMALAIGVTVWVYRARNVHIVKVSQPSFLLMVAAGVMVLVSSLIPLSFDDKGDPDSFSDAHGSLACMSVPWLASTGFTITFSALFSKTLRVNKIFHNKQTFTRVRVTAKDVLVPFMILFTLNIIILTLWTTLDPLTYVREDLPGTDGWNRVIATYGSCQSENATPYLVPLAVVNLSVLVLANWQAYHARMIQSEFSESKYIGIAMASLLQAMLSGIPILFVVRDSPQAYYLVLAFMIFIICTVVLIVIFVPKMVLVGKHSHETEEEQKRRILSSIHQTRQSIQQKSYRLDSSMQFSGGSMANSGIEEGSSTFNPPMPEQARPKNNTFDIKPLSIMDEPWKTEVEPVMEESQNFDSSSNSCLFHQDHSALRSISVPQQENRILASPSVKARSAQQLKQVCSTVTTEEGSTGTGEEAPVEHVPNLGNKSRTSKTSIRFL